MKLAEICVFRVVPVLFMLLLMPYASAYDDISTLSVSSGYYGEGSNGCSVITISKGGNVFFGGNDDYTNPDSYYWVDPGDGNRFGAIWIGEPDNVQQGINEHGLAYDANGLPRIDVNAHEERLPVEGSYTSYPIHILHECATVEEVIGWIETHRWHSFMHDQLHFADTTGDAVIISAGEDGELVFTRKKPGDGFLVSTNFNVAIPSNGYSYPCQRYNTAQRMLGELVNNNNIPLTVSDVRDVLDAIHVESITSWTIESFLADLTNGLVYIYYFYQYDNPVVLNVREELAHPREPGPLSMLFSPEVREEAGARYDDLQERKKLCRKVAVLWLAAMVLSVFLFLILSRHREERYRFWLTAVIITGPIAVIIWMITGRRYRGEIWRLSLLETVGDILPSVPAFLMILFLSIVMLLNSPAYQLVSFLAVPFILAWPLFNVLFFRGMRDENGRRFLTKRIISVLITTNMAVGGISIVTMPLVNKSMSICPILPLSGWTMLVFWLIIVAGTLPGMLLVYSFNNWMVRRGFRAWTALSYEEETAAIPSVRKVWWWLLISYVVIFAGMTAGVLLQ